MFRTIIITVMALVLLGNSGIATAQHADIQLWSTAEDSGAHALTS